LQWIEECGHVPHLEKPEETASAIASFVTSTQVSFATTTTVKKKLSTTDGEGAGNEIAVPPYVIGGGFLGALLFEEAIKFFF
jgi:hypothetical protein